MYCSHGTVVPHSQAPHVPSSNPFLDVWPEDVQEGRRPSRAPHCCHGLERGALLRPLGDVIYFMPPYVIQPEEIDFLARVAWEGINAATA